MLPRHRRAPYALALVLASACGPTAAESRRAERAVYQTEFSRVWNAVSETVKGQYPRLAIEDPVNGRILTDWHLVERVDEEPVAQSSGGGGQSQLGSQGPGQGGQPIVQAGRFFRIAVVIKPGGPPWKLEVDGEAALYQPGMAMIQPYEHTDADEPSWVGPRIDKVRVGIFKRLEGYAHVIEEAAPKGPPPLDKGPWANLPKGAPEVVAQVNAAARKRDTRALRRLMADDFMWSAGGAPSADTAVTLWSADPPLLARLVRVLEAGCRERETDTLIVCPTRTEAGRADWRAEFRKHMGVWRFAAFFQEEE